MKNSVVIIGVGEMGGVFARGFLKLGHPVFPINRGDDIKAAAANIENVESVIVAVGEKDIQESLKAIPDTWRDKLVLLQNELLPRDWTRHDLAPTVISVWFEKKRPNDFKVIIPSPVYGPQARLVADALGAIDISTNVLNSEDELLTELVIKNLYILTSNISGLEVGGTVGKLWNEHNEIARAVANDVLDIQFKMIGKELDRDKLIDGMVKAFEGDRDHKCMGRSAPGRLKRALKQADEFGIEVKKLKGVLLTL